MTPTDAGQHIFIPDALLEADVGIVLGMNDWKRPAARAVELHRAGKAARLLFTGGYNAKIGAGEAMLMAAFAQARGVAKADILVEPTARHTDENLGFSRALLEDDLAHGRVRAILLVTIHYHVRRALLAARRHFPPSVRIGWVCYPSLHYDSRDWRNSPHGRRHVEQEVDKIEKYYSVSLKESADAAL